MGDAVHISFLASIYILHYPSAQQYVISLPKGIFMGIPLAPRHVQIWNGPFSSTGLRRTGLIYLTSNFPPLSILSLDARTTKIRGNSSLNAYYRSFREKVISWISLHLLFFFTRKWCMGIFPRGESAGKWHFDQFEREISHDNLPWCEMLNLCVFSASRSWFSTGLFWS